MKVLLVQNTASPEQMNNICELLANVGCNVTLLLESSVTSNDLASVVVQVKQADVVVACLTSVNLTSLAMVAIRTAKRLGVRLVAVWLKSVPADSKLPLEINRYGSAAVNQNAATIRMAVVEKKPIWVDAAGKPRPAPYTKPNKCKKRNPKMRLHSYIVEHDLGFAPNPFHGVCSLAACKPKIRKYAHLGEYIIGTGTKKREQNGRLVYAMKVGRIISFDEYWNDRNFDNKRPTMNGSFIQRYGDNIYHRDEAGAWLQEKSFHSHEDGTTDIDNLQTDVGTTEKVLLADWFVYWGEEAPAIPTEFHNFVQSTQGHKSIDDRGAIDDFVRWIKSFGQEGPWAIRTNGDTLRPARPLAHLLALCPPLRRHLCLSVGRLIPALRPHETMRVCRPCGRRKEHAQPWFRSLSAAPSRRHPSLKTSASRPRSTSRRWRGRSGRRPIRSPRGGRRPSIFACGWPAAACSAATAAIAMGRTRPACSSSRT
ncbi:MAG: hypothetical protein WDM84_04410 [Bauldia sp.]